MLSNTAEKLIRRIGIWRIAFVILQLLAIVIFLWLSSLLVESLRQKYSFYHPFVSLLIASAIASLLLMRALLRFQVIPARRILQKLDEEHHLLDRLSTYYQLRNTDHPFLGAFIAEIENRIGSLSTFPLVARTSKPGAAIACILALLFSLLIMPYLPEAESVVRLKQEKQRITTEAKKLERETLRIQRENNHEAEKLLKDFEKTAQELQKPGMRDEQALKKLNDLQQELQDQQTWLSAQQKDRLARELKGLAESQSNKAEKEAIQDLADQIQSEEQAKDPGDQAEQVLKDHQLSVDAQKQLKQAIKNYEAEQNESGKQAAEMQKALENARKGLAPGTHKWTADSRISERDLEKSKAGVSDGPGTTNEDVGPQSFDTKKKGKSEYIEDRTKEQYEQLYKGQREKAGSEPLFLKSQWDQNREQKYIPIRNFGLDKKSSAEPDTSTSVAQDPGESALRQEKVPASYQKIVKKYFESIKQ